MLKKYREKEKETKRSWPLFLRKFGKTKYEFFMSYG